MNFWKKLLDVSVDVAPTIAGAAATVAGGPAAGAIVGGVFKRILGKEPTSADDLESMARDILGDPEKLQQFRLAMRQAELEELRIRAMDVQDARKTLDKSKGAVVISVFVVIAYTLAMTFAMTSVIPAGSQNIAYLLLGNLATGFGMVLTFWLGSSVGSKEKTEILKRYAEAASHDQAERAKP